MWKKPLLILLAGFLLLVITPARWWIGEAFPQKRKGTAPFGARWLALGVVSKRPFE